MLLGEQKGTGCHRTVSDACYPQASSVELILAKRCLHTWEDPEIYQIWTLNQANQNDWPKETQKKCPMYVI